jgi:hypothetical protein
MGAEVPQRLTGEAAWKAAKERVANRNAATHADAREARAARDAQAIARKVAEEREERKSRPAQPTRS